ncbi:hypothetical protein E4634_17240 [Mangrovimicrobium sediminis]|uniref:Uncharacterized protein n=1 Tax=Mangrovimicrobium sediminis TaxID=2562682 RepID=A0A4Z0LXG8_9GAMM|nr:hypothetical protein [Haliea sp. SAOS-164]TGD71856.1 hypothetical protein E4634_17240 [Haliea sp. SAOS-164]
MFKNKHIIVAMLVTPVLALLAWFGVGHFAGEKAAPAQPGQAYPLVEQSNCRWTSGACDLRNADFRLHLTLDSGPSGPEFELVASHPLEGVLVGLGNQDAQVQPQPMRPSDGQGLRWRIALAAVPAPDERLHLVARAGGSSYFGEAATTFVQPREP